MPLGDGPNAWREPGAEPVIDLDHETTKARTPLDQIADGRDVPAGVVEGYNALEPEPMTPRERRNSWREVVQHVT